jgi:tetratricopeptide (TPR) repeat protein
VGLVLWLASPAWAQSDEVVLTDGTVHLPKAWLTALIPPEVANPERPEKGPGPWVSARDVVLTEAEDAIRVRATWTIDAVASGWVDLPLVDAAMRVDDATLGGEGVALRALRDGRRHLVAYIEGPTELVLEGEIVGGFRRGMTVSLLEAPVGRLVVQTDDPVVDVTAGSAEVVELEDAFWTGAQTLQVTSSAVEPAAKTGQLAVGRVGLGVTVSDQTMGVRARMQWQVVRGAFDQVAFSIPAAGPDLEVTGGGIARWERSGDRVVVELLEPQKAGVELEARWSVSLPDRDEVKVPFPTVALEGVFRSEAAVQIARDGDREVVPDFGGWQPLPTAELPEVARDLVVGTPASAWRITDASQPSLGLLRFSPVAGPPTIVDVAAYNGALSRDGRLLMRAHYTVRNDRGAFLRVVPPRDTRIVGARVNGEPVAIARDGAAWLVPLEKSVETVQGLLSFPIDLVFLQDDAPFEKKDERAVPLPTLDAEVAVSRVTMALPVGWENRLEPGEQNVVADFTEGEGLTYGFKSGDANVARADALFQEAVGAWMSNDFDAARDALDALDSIGASNENVARLRSNVDLVLSDDDGRGEGGGGQAVALQRRVKEQAQARAKKDVAKQAELLSEADEAYLSGDYDKAEAVYEEALQIGKNLERIEQDESVEQSYSNVALEQKLTKAKKEKKKKGVVRTGGRPDQAQFDFEDADISGELVQPDGAVILGGDAGSEDGESLSTRSSTRFESLVQEAEAEQRSREEVEARRRYEEEVARRAAEEAARVAEAERRRYEEEERKAEEEAYRKAIEEEARRAQPSTSKPRPPAAVEDIQVLKRSRPSIQLPRFGGSRKVPPAASEPPPPPAPPDAGWVEIEIEEMEDELTAPEPEPEGFAPLDVTASSLDVVIPTFGETVRYQHLLLPAGADLAVVVRAKSKKNPRK